MKAREYQARLSEAEFQEKVVALAKAKGWLVHHTRPARTEKGWRTPVQGHVGFPDLVMARDGKILIVELKSESGRVTQQQQAWLDHLQSTKGNAETDRIVHVFRPSQWANLQELLE